MAKIKKEKEAKKLPEAQAQATGDISVFPATEKVAESMSEKFDKEAKALFDEYTDKEAFHFTSDGLAFFQHSDARNHAKSLERKDVITKVRK